MQQNNILLVSGPKGESTGDSQDEEGGDEEEIGHVDDGEDDDDDMEEEPQGAISGGTEEQWTVSEFETRNSLQSIILVLTCMCTLPKALHFFDLGR